jgi:conjugative transfer signal peptidase TraF
MDKRRIGITALVLCVGLWGGTALAFHFGYRINLTDSAPHGLWRVNASTPLQNLQRGDLVELCAPDHALIRIMEKRGLIERGDCPDTHAVSFLKPVAAIAGDVVVLRHGEDVTINGRRLQNTKALNAVPAWSNGTYRVASGTIWVFSSYSEGSLDSRYFGPVSLSRVYGTVKPVLVNGDVTAMAPWSRA